MGGSSFARGWLVAAWLGTACSAGVIDGSGAEGFGSATTPMTTTVTSTTAESSGGVGSSEAGSLSSSASGEASDDAPADSSGSMASSDGGVDSEGPARCGNGIAEGDEDCDGRDLGGAECADFGFDDGVLVCDPACSLVTEACFTCGDGEIALNEVCDGTNFGGETCDSLGFGGGNLSCSADCQEIVDDACTPLPSCGDGLLNGGEQCDGNLLGGASCATQGFDLGELGCTGACTYDVSACMDDLTGCGMMGDFCIFDENDLQSTCCPAGVGGNMFGICNVFICV